MGGIVVILEYVNANSGIYIDGIVELVGNISALGMQTIDKLGGVRSVESLIVIGFTIGLLACLHEIKKING